MLNINLSSKLAQKIADRTMEILDYNINIRDKTGKIIASGDQNRLNDCSQLAAQGIKNNQILKVSRKEAENIAGMEPGVQIPLNFNNEIIGAVDITGQLEEVEVYVGLIKITVELLLQQAYYLKKIQLEEAGEHFIKELIKKDFDHSANLIKDRAEVLGYNVEAEYLICILEISNFWENILKNLGDSDTLGFQKHKRQIMREIENFFNSRLKIDVFHLEGEKFLILKSCSLSKCDNLFTGNCDQLIENLNQKFDFKYKIGVGRKVKGLEAIWQSYQDSSRAMELGKKFYPQKSAYYYQKQELERIVADLQPETRNKLLGRLNLEKHYLETLEEYFKTDMNMSKTAENLALHRNSIVYRLNKVAELTGLDPKKSADIVKLQLALLAYKYENLN